MRANRGGLNARRMRFLLAAMNQLILFTRWPAVQVELFKIIAAGLLKVGDGPGT